MKLEFKKRLLEIDLYGEEVTLNFPTVGQYRSYADKVSATPDDESNLTVELLAELGMPKQKFDSLEPLHLKEILEALVGVEKK